MAQQDTDQIFREVDEELRRERYEQLWKQYGTYVMAGALAIVIGVGGYKLNQYWRAKQAAEAGARFNSALLLLEDKKTEEADKALAQMAQKSPGGYGALAGLRRAAIEAAAGRTAEALKAYEALAKDTSVDAVLRGFAEVKAAMLRVDQADWTEMQNRLKHLTDASNPWRFSARELLGLSAWKAGNTAEAERQFQALRQERGVPSGMSQRAEMMLALLVEQAKPAAAPPAASAESQAPAAKSEPAAPAPGEAKR